MDLAGYGSDSDSDNESTLQQQPSQPPKASTSTTALSTATRPSIPKPPVPAPPPSGPSYSSASGISLPPPTKTRKRAAPKFTLEDAVPASSSSTPIAPSVSTAATPPSPPKPKPKPTPPSGSGTSSLLGMLPAPKQALPKAKPLPKPVILKPLDIAADGTIESFIQGHGEEEEEEEPVAMDFSRKRPLEEKGEKEGAAQKKMNIVKPLDLKGKGGTKVEKPVMDFFGLAATPSTSKSTPTDSSSSTTASLAKPSFSAAPSLPKAAPPPPPTPSDPYPGYYLDPTTSQWAAYDPTFYASYAKLWEEEANAGKTGRGWEGLDSGRQVVDGEFSVGKSMEKDVGKRDEAAKARKFVPPPPAEMAKPPKNNGKNQLSSLIQNARSNKDALEEQIAQAKRNKRAAGQAYGF